MHRRSFLRSSTALFALGADSPVNHSGVGDEGFQAYQARRRKELWNLLGDLPEQRPPRARLVRTEKREGYALEHLELDLNGIEPVPAYLLLPDKRAKRAAALLYIHAHGGTYELGKEELVVGRKALPAYASVCAAKGIVTLAIDSWCFSGRKHQEDGRNGEWDAFKLMLWEGRVLWGMMLFDEVQALTYLCQRPEVDSDRIGAFGLSMGFDQSLVAGGARPARQTMHRSLLFDGLPRADSDSQLERSRHLLLRAAATKTFSDARDQRIDRAAGPAQPERTKGYADAAGRRRTNSGSFALALHNARTQGGLSDRALRLRA